MINICKTDSEIIGKENLKKAMKIVEELLNDEDYARSWIFWSERKRALKSEKIQIQKLLEPSKVFHLFKFKKITDWKTFS